MKQYDYAFSLGWACGCSQALRAAGLQIASEPLDWTAVWDVLTSARMIASRFDHWLDAEDLHLVDVCHSVGFCTRVYVNSRTGFGFSHEFSDFEPFSVVYPRIKEMYDRRIARFLATLQAKQRILAVYCEHTRRGKASDEDIRETLKILRDFLPGKEVDLLYFYEDPALKEMTIQSEMDGITIVAGDYRVIENGQIMQYMQIPRLTKFITEHVSVVKVANEEGQSEVKAICKAQRQFRWGVGKSRFRQWLNHHAYKLYRTLERILRKRGVIHPDLLIWFWDESGRPKGANGEKVK